MKIDSKIITNPAFVDLAAELSQLLVLFYAKLEGERQRTRILSVRKLR